LAIEFKIGELDEEEVTSIENETIIEKSIGEYVKSSLRNILNQIFSVGAGLISGLTLKETPDDTDMLVIEDSNGNYRKVLKSSIGGGDSFWVAEQDGISFTNISNISKTIINDEINNSYSVLVSSLLDPENSNILSQLKIFRNTAGNYITWKSGELGGFGIPSSGDYVMGQHPAFGGLSFWKVGSSLLNFSDSAVLQIYPSGAESNPANLHADSAGNLVTDAAFIAGGASTPVGGYLAGDINGERILKNGVEITGGEEWIEYTPTLRWTSGRTDPISFSIQKGGYKILTVNGDYMTIFGWVSFNFTVECEYVEDNWSFKLPFDVSDPVISRMGSWTLYDSFGDKSYDGNLQTYSYQGGNALPKIKGTDAGNENRIGTLATGMDIYGGGTSFNAFFMYTAKFQ
jgi:hypothetical protein